MTTSLLKRENSVACRACGALEAGPEDANGYGLCESCFRRYLKYCRMGERSDSENEANIWIARQLFLSARRLEKFGVTGRCEAITDGSRVEYLANQGARSGFQCARQATMLRDGRRCCNSHGKTAHLVLFVESSGNPYDEFGRIVWQMARIDRRFFDAAERALAQFRIPGDVGGSVDPK